MWMPPTEAFVWMKMLYAMSVGDLAPSILASERFARSVTKAVARAVPNLGKTIYGPGCFRNL